MSRLDRSRPSIPPTKRAAQTCPIHLAPLFLRRDGGGNDGLHLVRRRAWHPVCRAAGQPPPHRARVALRAALPGAGTSHTALCDAAAARAALPGPHSAAAGARTHLHSTCCVAGSSTSRCSVAADGRSAPSTYRGSDAISGRQILGLLQVRCASRSRSFTVMDRDVNVRHRPLGRAGLPRRRTIAL